jgi:hypothetical protein
MRKRLRKKKDKQEVIKMVSNEPLICDDCGKQGEDVKKTICPYDDEILNRQTSCVLCNGCYNLRSDEI